MRRDSEGTYTCRATNRCGSAEASKRLRIKDKKPGAPRVRTVVYSSMVTREQVIMVLAGV